MNPMPNNKLLKLTILLTTNYILHDIIYSKIKTICEIRRFEKKKKVTKNQSKRGKTDCRRVSGLNKK